MSLLAGEFMRGINPISKMLGVGAVIWFFIGAVDLFKAYVRWADTLPRMNVSEYALSYYVYQMFDSLFLLGTAAMVELLYRIWMELKTKS